MDGSGPVCTLHSVLKQRSFRLDKIVFADYCVSGHSIFLVQLDSFNQAWPLIVALLTLDLDGGDSFNH